MAAFETNTKSVLYIRSQIFRQVYVLYNFYLDHTITLKGMNGWNVDLKSYRPSVSYETGFGPFLKIPIRLISFIMEWKKKSCGALILYALNKTVKASFIKVKKLWRRVLFVLFLFIGSFFALFHGLGNWEMC